MIQICSFTVTPQSRHSHLSFILGTNLCWRHCVVHSRTLVCGVGLRWKGLVLLSLRGRIITKHEPTSSYTKAALTSSLLVASRGWSHSLLALLTQNTSHHSWEAKTSCSITRHESDFFQLHWTAHKPSLTTSSAQTEQREDGWAGTQHKGGLGWGPHSLNKVVIHFSLTSLPNHYSCYIWSVPFLSTLDSSADFHLPTPPSFLTSCFCQILSLFVFLTF